VVVEVVLIVDEELCEAQEGVSGGCHNVLRDPELRKRPCWTTEVGD